MALLDVLSDALRTVTYWPHQRAHEHESARIPWVIFLSWILLGSAAASVNVWFGMALATIGLCAGAGARVLVLGRRPDAED